MGHRWARLQPYNAKTGCVVQRYNFGEQLYLGGPKPHWYRVDEAKAKQLGELRQNLTDPHAPPLFQIVDEAFKEKIDKLEYDRRMVELGLIAQTAPEPVTIHPIDVDLTEGGRETAIPPTEPETVAPEPRQTSSSRTVLAPTEGASTEESPTSRWGRKKASKKKKKSRGK